MATERLSPDSLRVTMPRQQSEEPRRGRRTAEAGAAEWQRLVESLRTHGVRHLSLPASSTDAPPLPLAELVDDLLRTPDPRLRQAVVPLLLTHPEYARLVQERIEHLPPELADRARRLYLVSAALQRMW